MAELIRRAKMGKSGDYRTLDGQMISVALSGGAFAWTIGNTALDRGQPIAKRAALALIAERMKAKLG